MASRCIVWLQTPDLSGEGVRPVPDGQWCGACVHFLAYGSAPNQQAAYVQFWHAGHSCRDGSRPLVGQPRGAGSVHCPVPDEPPHTCRFKSELGTKVVERGICASTCTETHPRSSGRIVLAAATSPIGAVTSRHNRAHQGPFPETALPTWHADGLGGVWGEMADIPGQVVEI